ncbi:MAG: hypothetical protein V4797_05845 [Paraburkholderia tropica]|uniref:hypothetical protein n=1 Tax=Paraburkholderia tropica TaxID=92647 RepID=UPI00310180BB
MTKKRLQGTVNTPEMFGEACIRETVKLGVAAFESAAQVDSASVDARSCAWQFIKYYYAAYFAANGLMRLSGQACINLTALDCASINSWALAHGVGGSREQDKLAPGLFQLSFDATHTPTFALRLHSGKGGVHIQFWSGFLTFLQKLRSDIHRSPAPKVERDSAIADLDLLEGELQRGGVTHASWLSEMRNAVNYRFEYGAWFPYNAQASDKTALRDSFRLHARAPSRFVAAPAAASELVRAGRVCGYLVGWLRDSLCLIDERAKGEKATLTKGALTFADKM